MDTMQVNNRWDMLDASLISLRHSMKDLALWKELVMLEKMAKTIQDERIDRTVAHAQAAMLAEPTPGPVEVLHARD